MKRGIMAKKSQRSTKKQHKRPRHRRLSLFPYVIMALLIIGIPFGIYQLYTSNVDRTVKKLDKAIKSHDIEFMEEKTERLPIILDVFEKSYSEDSDKQKEFYDSNFKNLEIQVLETERKPFGKEVKLSISNVNYIDIYDKVDDSESDDKIHSDYMALLSDPNQEKNTREATIFLKRKFSGYDINESRDFINAILGGALEYADDGEDLTNKTKDTIDDAMNDN